MFSTLIRNFDGFYYNTEPDRNKEVLGAKSCIFKEEEMKPFNPANDFTSKISYIEATFTHS